MSLQNNICYTCFTIKIHVLHHFTFKFKLANLEKITKKDINPNNLSSTLFLQFKCFFHIGIVLFLVSKTLK